MKTDKINIVIDQPFEQVLTAARKAIVNNGFLLLHEINPQVILASHQIVIGPIRQLLFFHPVYMHQLLQADPAAVIEVPLKLVLREVADHTTAVTYSDPLQQLQGYSGLETLGSELSQRVTALLEELL
ncbi:uncharacterized protein (DUF302 family) [Chitinophaga polysaccharea]|uniref:Uncharacterized protein (DUF302 family) n=1 Tax=Chitinophaga polysaccharea TaxID=1293035 RepID=A0A561PR15_9BACT|nr:DUF302 domain-containing protein [Chitinophaga polysaccharea]TWF40545.1 uncharacterized protein (DUF302 family) [Chitinophaga polysaccharea]